MVLFIEDVEIVLGRVGERYLLTALVLIDRLIDVAVVDGAPG